MLHCCLHGGGKQFNEGLFVQRIVSLHFCVCTQVLSGPVFTRRATVERKIESMNEGKFQCLCEGRRKVISYKYGLFSKIGRKKYLLLTELEVCSLHCWMDGRQGDTVLWWISILRFKKPICKCFVIIFMFESWISGLKMAR